MTHSDVALETLRARLADEGVGAVAVNRFPNVRYVTGFSDVFDEEEACVALVTASAATIFADSRYTTAVADAAQGTQWHVSLVSGSVSTSVCEALAADGVTSLALESTIPHDRWGKFAEKFDGEVVNAEGWVEELRTVKGADEIAAIEAAQALTDRTFDHLVQHVVGVGATERQIAIELEFFMRREGSEGVAFAPIVAAGPNSAMPHAKPGDRALVSGDFVVLDFGARVDGYCADMTRTVVVGPPDEGQLAMYNAVLAANLAGIAAVAPGLTGREIDAAARAVIEDAGFGEYFGHGLGHGVGLEVHERPGVGSRSASRVPLGSVITIEPGVYIPGVGGVRIEDLAVVEERGARVLTRSAKELLEV